MEEIQKLNFCTDVLEYIEASFGINGDMDCVTIMALFPILGTIIGAGVLIKLVSGASDDGEDMSKCEFTIHVIATVIVTLGLGFFLFLIGTLVTLGKALKNACSCA